MGSTYGASMAPPWTIPLSDVVVGDELADAVADAVRSGWWSMGPRVAEFESAFGSSTGSAHALAVANGTAALHIALLAAGCGPGDEVVLPALNFVAAANTIAHTGAMPVFCDIGGSGDLNLDPADLEAAITENTRAIVALHYAGYPCDMDAVLAIAQRHGLIVIEDAAHAPGGSWRGRPCGSLGAAGCFSFFSNKNLAIGEGGMIEHHGGCGHGGADAPAALPRDDDADLGSTPRPCSFLRCSCPWVQLSPRRSSSCDGARATPTPRCRQRCARKARRPLPLTTPRCRRD